MPDSSSNHIQYQEIPQVQEPVPEQAVSHDEAQESVTVQQSVPQHRVSGETVPRVGSLPAMRDTLGISETDTLGIQMPVHKADSVPGVYVSVSDRGMPVQKHQDTLSSISWVVAVLLLMFVLLSVKFKNNFRFLREMASDLVSVRRRNNMFDDTLRETSFLLALIVLCIAEVSIISLLALRHFVPAACTIPLTHLLGICSGCVCALYLLQWIAYNICGYIFSDPKSTRMWVRAFGTSQGLLGIALFPVTLALIFNPQCSIWLIWVGAGCFGLARILFIYKGFRIFSTQIGSWVLFLYYLCSLEVIPILLTAVGICALCGL